MRQQHFRDTRTGEIVTQFPVHEIAHFEKHNGAQASGTPCDDRCTHAKGPDCNCKCNGANHGIYTFGTGPEQRGLF